MMRQLRLFDVGWSKRRTLAIALFAVACVALFAGMSFATHGEPSPTIAEAPPVRDLEVIELSYANGEPVELSMRRKYHDLELRVAALECAVRTPAVAIKPRPDRVSTNIDKPQTPPKRLRLLDLFPRLRDANAARRQVELQPTPQPY
jgi:hypothetical protein